MAKPTAITKQVKKMQTLHISAEAHKLLWRNRAETGRTASSTVETLIIKYLKGHRRTP